MLFSERKGKGQRYNLRACISPFLAQSRSLDDVESLVMIDEFAHSIEVERLLTV